jgi:uncharacterized protein (TIGR03437 family)
MMRLAGLLVLASIGHAQTVVIGAGYTAPGAIDVAPGQVITIFARIPGKTPSDPVAAKAPLPAGLAGFSVLLRQTFPSDPTTVPVASVSDYQSCSTVAPLVCDTVSMITVQVPFELTPNAPRTTMPQTTAPQNFARLEISYNGAQTNALIVNPVPDKIHVLNSCDAAATMAGAAATSCLPLVKRPDGSLVSADNPAQPGEVLTVSLVGLGPTPVSVATGAAAPSLPPAVDGVTLGLDTRVNVSPAMPDPAAAVPAQSAQLQSGTVGIYQVTFTVPALSGGASLCSGTVRSNLTVNITRAASYDGVGICVAPAPQQ